MADSVQNIAGIENLTAKQVKAIELLCDYENNMTYEAVAEEVGVCYKTLYNWRTRNEDFINVKKKMSEFLLKEKIERVNRSLLRGAVEGEPRLIKLFYERLGMYKDRKEISGPDGGPVEVDPISQLKEAINKVSKDIEDEESDE